MTLSYSRSLFWKLFLPFAFVLVLSFAAAALFLPQLIQGNAEREAIAAGKETVRQFKTLRTYYTDNVIAKVLQGGQLKVSFEHAGKNDTVPLPATMIHELSMLLQESGTTLKLYSPYPFPNRQQRTMDSFGQDAWRFLQANPDQTYSRVETIGGKSVVRVAMADRMNRPACVACHNGMAASPRRDWKLNDVRGVLEVNSSRQLATGQSIIYQLFAVFATIMLLLAVLLRVLYQHAVARPLDIALGAARTLTASSVDKVRAAEAIASGNLERDLAVAVAPAVDPASISGDEAGQLLTSVVEMGAAQLALDHAFRTMTASLRASRDEAEARNWIKTGQNDLNTLMRGEQELELVADKVLSYLAERVGAGAGALLLVDEDSPLLCVAARYAMADGARTGERIEIGQGLAGQAAKERRTLLVSDVPNNYLPIGSTLGSAAPACVIVLPLLHGASLVGVLELAAFSPFTEAELAFLESATEAVAIGFEVSLSRQRTRALLEETEQQSEELRVQQEELQQSNEELEERADLLVRQREQIEARNADIEAASGALRQKAAQLQAASAFKTEFMANMSHELRTPLNSMLILSGLLKENKNARLSPKQVEYATTINNAGKDLLNLINDILDLSKVEAGQVEFHYEDTASAGLCTALEQLFHDSAHQKGLRFVTDCASDLPARVHIDLQRTQQVLKNLIGNAIKFTERGEVTLRLYVPDPMENVLPVPALAFAVSDTGIGVPLAKRDVIFEAFKQADGGISRNYGGTGLGLSISLQLARGMHGALTLTSEEGRGSTFTLYLPAGPAADAPAPAAAPPRRALVYAPARHDDREALPGNGRSILVIEDDPAFAGILMDFVRAHGFAAIVAGDGESGVALAAHFVPSAILLDVRLPRLDGWDVMQRLKQNPATRHIPVHFISCTEQGARAMDMGAIGFVSKPVSADQLNDVIGTIEAALDTAVKRLLIVEDDAGEAASLAALLAARGLEIALAGSGGQALALLGGERFDCMVLDLGLPDMSGLTLLARIQDMEQARRIPVIVHSGCPLTPAQQGDLQRYAESIIVKDASSPERLLNEVTLFLHMVERGTLAASHGLADAAPADGPAALDGKVVLIVDDDMRNVFSLTSLLSDKGLRVLEAENGREALQRLGQHPEIAIVLMDIMMPDMDGYEAMRRIRAEPAWQELPVIAMTAKAMQGDQQKCYDAGASDYIAKPIDTDKLMSLLRVWCGR